MQQRRHFLQLEIGIIENISLPHIEQIQLREAGNPGSSQAGTLFSNQSINIIHGSITNHHHIILKC